MREQIAEVDFVTADAAAGLLLGVSQSSDLIDQDRYSWRHMTKMWAWEGYAG
jgi:hypothetical protein